MFVWSISTHRFCILQSLVSLWDGFGSWRFPSQSIVAVCSAVHVFQSALLFFYEGKKSVRTAGCHKRKVEFVSRKRRKKPWAATSLKSFIKSRRGCSRRCVVLLRSPHMLTFLSLLQAMRVRSSATETHYDSTWRPEEGFWEETTGTRQRTGERRAFRSRLRPNKLSLFLDPFGHFSCCRCMRCTHSVLNWLHLLWLFSGVRGGSCSWPAAHQACALVCRHLSPQCCLVSVVQSVQTH